MVGRTATARGGNMSRGSGLYAPSHLYALYRVSMKRATAMAITEGLLRDVDRLKTNEANREIRCYKNN